MDMKVNNNKYNNIDDEILFDKSNNKQKIKIVDEMDDTDSDISDTESDISDTESDISDTDSYLKQNNNVGINDIDNYYNKLQYTYLNKDDINNIKKKLSSNNFVDLIKKHDEKYHNILKELQNDYDMDPLEILFKIRFKDIENIDANYYNLDNIKYLLLKSNYFTELGLLNILGSLVCKYNLNQIISSLKLNNVNKIKISNKNRLLVIDYIINYHDPEKKYLDHKIHAKYEMTNYIGGKVDLYYNNLYNKINCLQNIQNDNLVATKEYILKDKKNIHYYLNTENSDVINWIIKNQNKKVIIVGLDKLLKSNEIKIKEQDVINILKLFINKNGKILKSIDYSTSISENLIKHCYLIAYNLFETQHIDNTRYIFQLEREIIYVLKSGDEKKIKYLLKSEVGKQIVNNNIFWDIILFNIELTKVIISEGITLPYKYINDRFTNTCVVNSFVLTSPRKYGINYYTNIKSYIKNNKKNDNIAIYYNNLCKFNIPLNDNLICNFIKYIPIKSIINFYKKTSDVDVLLPYIIYTNYYQLLDKLIEENIYEIGLFKKNFKKYLKKITGNNRYDNKIGLIYKAYSSGKKYGIKPDSYLLIMVIKYGNKIMLKNILKSNKNYKINVDTIKRLLKDNNYSYRIKKFGEILDYIQPWVKNFNLIYSDIVFVNKIAKTYGKLSLEKIIDLNSKCPEFIINLTEGYEYNFDYSKENLINVFEYIFKNNFTVSKGITHKSVFNINFTGLINLLCYNKYTRIMSDKFIELYNKYLLKDNKEYIIPKNKIFEQLYENTYKTVVLLDMYTKLGFFKHNIYTNTFMVCISGGYEDCSRILEYCFKICPYLQQRTYFYLESVLLKYKNLINNSTRKKSTYYIKSLHSKVEYYQDLIKLIPKSNIISSDNLHKYIDIEKERPDRINHMKLDFSDYMFDDIVCTDQNNILLDL